MLARIVKALVIVWLLALASALVIASTMVVVEVWVKFYQEVIL